MNAKEINDYLFAALKQMSELDATDLRDIGNEAEKIIKTRTKQGLDTRRTIFKAYSPEYKKTRAKQGLKTFPVDLTVSEKMLDATYVAVSPGKISIGNTSDVAVFHNAGTVNEPKREFLGIDNIRDVKALEDKIKQRLDTKASTIKR